MLFETITRLTEAVSLVLAVPTIAGAAAVLVVWLPTCLRHRTNTPRDLLLLGITVGFAGSAVDNIYWAVAWSDAFMRPYQASPFLFSLGVYFNVVFRQTLGTLAAYLHLRAYCNTAIDRAVAIRTLNAYTAYSTLLGVLYVVFLYMWSHQAV